MHDSPARTLDKISGVTDIVAILISQ
jgi:hypothetical protein